MDYQEAVQLATLFANASGYRLVPNFDGAAWEAGAIPVTFDAARQIEGEWAVLFDKMPPPGVLCESPGDICIVVKTNGACRFYPLL